MIEVKTDPKKELKPEQAPEAHGSSATFSLILFGLAILALMLHNWIVAGALLIISVIFAAPGLIAPVVVLVIGAALVYFLGPIWIIALLLLLILIS